MVDNEKIQNVYDYLSINCKGKENAVRRTDIALRLGIHEKDLKKAIKTINESEEFDIIISDTHKCFVCKTEEEKIERVESAIKEAFILMEKSKILAKKAGLI